MILSGDNKIHLKEMKENSIDSVVTDPPYHLISIVKRFGKKGSAPAKKGSDGRFNRLGKGFMEKDWDGLDGGVGISNDPLFWAEVLRVMKPGAHLVAFGGTRTYHRMVCAIEDAGFEIRDGMQWLYGCYSEDTECLTDNGWKNYKDISFEDKILQWDSASNELTWATPFNVVDYAFDGDMVYFENRHTSQLLTPNHRVYAKIRKHSRNPIQKNYEVINARDIKDHWIKDFPLAGELLKGEEVKDPYLIGWWMTDAWKHGDGKACMFSQSKKQTLAKLRNYLDEIGAEYSEYTKISKIKNHQDEHTFYVTGEYSEYLLRNFNDRELSWDMLSWDFKSRCELLEGLLDGDGSRRCNEQNYSEVFWSIKPLRLDIFQALCLSLNFRSHIDYNKGCVYLNREKNSTQLQSRHRLKTERYVGRVWCLQTETGAFVVRRNGKAFISGNSGFPKSHNVGDGWGTALKPANEPIVLARKPLGEKTVQKNMEKWGTGAINIEGTRIEGEKKRGEEGRWPSNVMLDEEAGRMLGEQSRFFYCPKASKSEKNLGCEELEEKRAGGMIGTSKKSLKTETGKERNNMMKNSHPTVKPIALIKYLITLITPPNGTVLDPFLGSGTLGVAAEDLGFNWIGIEREEEYIEIAKARTKTESIGSKQTEMFQ